MIKIAKELEKLPLVRIGDIQDLQGNLKDLSEINYKKLHERIEKYGFKYPLYIWFENKIPYTVDGKQRHRVIGREYGDDTMLPYIEVYAKNKKEAKKEILAISSDYGNVTKEGFDEFTGGWIDSDFEQIKDETTFENWIDVEIKDEIEFDDVKEDSQKLKEFIEARNISRERGKDKNENNFWVCLVFQSFKQKQEFFEAIEDKSIPNLYKMYVDGETFSQKFDIKVSKNTQKPHKNIIEEKLKEMVLND